MGAIHSLHVHWVALVLLAGVVKISGIMDKITADCELEALHVGTRLADQFNMYDEDTEWDVRMHTEYMVEHMGFSGWIQAGLWKNTKLTAEHQNAPTLHQVLYCYAEGHECYFTRSSLFLMILYPYQQRGGWAGSKNISESAYWSFQDQWVYMMGDSTQRQIWATFVSPFQGKQYT